MGYRQRAALLQVRVTLRDGCHFFVPQNLLGTGARPVYCFEESSVIKKLAFDGGEFDTIVALFKQSSYNFCSPRLLSSLSL